MRERELREIFERTSGHCHFCGDSLDFDKRGWSPNLDGYWEVDHVIQRQKGGAKSSSNCLPACTRCNRLRWHRTGEAVRELLFIGLICRDQMIKDTQVGKEMIRLRENKLRENIARRTKRNRTDAKEPMFSPENLKVQSTKKQRTTKS